MNKKSNISSPVNGVKINSIGFVVVCLTSKSVQFYLYPRYKKNMFMPGLC